MLTSTPTPKPCLACDSPLKGRTDKKFCNDYCRNSFNNRLKGDSNNLMRNTNNALRKNRRILSEMLKKKGQAGRVQRDKLMGLGFQFKYLTHTHTNGRGKVYHFCYEYGYLSLENGWLYVVKKPTD
jgi:hypothetical protein